jgi:hypothetical protein
VEVIKEVPVVKEVEVEVVKEIEVIREVIDKKQTNLLNVRILLKSMR